MFGLIKRRTGTTCAAAAVAVAVLLPAGAHAATTTPKATAQHQSTKDVLFYDGFDGSTVDRTKWNVDVTQTTQYNNELEAYVDSPSTVQVVRGSQAQGAHGGALRLHANYDPGFKTPGGNSLDFTSGKVDTANKFDTAYGTVSARMKLPVGMGYWPAFWMLGYGAWPDTGEIDIMENIGDPNWVSAATHGPGYSGDAAPVNRAYLHSMQLADVSAWHTYAVRWTSDAMTFTIDGKVFFIETKKMISFFGTWAFDNPKYLILNLALGGIYPYKINGITSPYNGLSKSTLHSVKAGDGTVLVDWVKVVKA
jgi:beta-glucanase (GH16 family)